MKQRTVYKVLIVLAIVFALAGFGFMVTGCSALLGDKDPEIQARLMALETEAAQARVQVETALAKLKEDGFDPVAMSQVLAAMSSVNEISKQISEIRNQPDGDGAWPSIIVAILSGLAGYPIMRTARLRYSNSSISPPKA